jgi:hypothetical protein
MSARVAVDMNLFSLIDKEGPISSAQLAQLTGSEELLISKREDRYANKVQK